MQIAAGRHPHFLHRPDSRCATINPEGTPYDELADVPRDAEAAHALKSATVERIAELFHNCGRLAPGFDADEFRACLTRAQERDIWSYRGLDSGLLPYVLLLCHGRFEAHARFRPHAFFFVLPLRQRVDALWIHADSARHLLRIEVPSGEIQSLPVRRERIFMAEWLEPVQAEWRRRLLGP
jgi:hypothetical protein